MALTEPQIERYARHILLPEVGGAGQERLLAAKVRVIGGGAAAEACVAYLAGAGVGALDWNAEGLTGTYEPLFLLDARDAARPRGEPVEAAVARRNPDVKLGAVKEPDAVVEFAPSVSSHARAHLRVSVSGDFVHLARGSCEECLAWAAPAPRSPASIPAAAVAGTLAATEVVLWLLGEGALDGRLLAHDVAAGKSFQRPLPECPHREARA